MTLKLIPIEPNNGNGPFADADYRKGKRRKHFNPGSRISKKSKKESSLKNVCLQLVHFINRGGRFTYQQIDELIMGMQKSILSLQKKKGEILKRKDK